MVTAAPSLETPSFPTAPRTLDESGLELDLIIQLVLKTVYFSGQLTGLELADRLKLAFPVIEPALEQLVAERYLAIVDGGLIGRSSFTYRISDAGRERAVLFLKTSHYVGAAPVPLAQYQAYMRDLQAQPTNTVGRSVLTRAIQQKLVVSDAVIGQLGPAINARHSLFLYGPPGNGKSVIAAAMGHLLTGGIEVPYALEVEGSIVRVFDPVHHDPIPIEPEADSVGLETGPRHDDRWIHCHRPIVTVGGELQLEHLDLIFEASVGFYRAPLQVKANGGVLVIDDFGRQQCSPQALLNRWIVPLETRQDYLTLQTGQSISVPFSPFVVFATNIKPEDLLDEAFLRRIHYKVFAQSPTIQEFLQIFERVCSERGLVFKRREVEDLLERFYRPRNLPLRGCHPRDLVDHVVSSADFLEQEPALTTELLDAACASYFVQDEDRAGASTLWNVLPSRPTEVLPRT